MFIFIITHCNVQVEQINTHPCKMTLVTLRAAQSKLLKVREVFIQDNFFKKFIGNKPCDEVLGAAQCTRLETSFTSTTVKLRKRLRYDLLLTVT